MKNAILLIMPALIAAFFMSSAESEYEKVYKRTLKENTIKSYEMFLQNCPENVARVKSEEPQLYSLKKRK